ncbi:MAG: AAA family ATPase [Rhizomicrobium sp.]
MLFTPSAPIDESDLFAGRQTQIRRLIEVVLERGKHAVLYGERGVGKTSLAKVFPMLFPSIVKKVLLFREQIDPTDNFSSAWMKVFKDIPVQDMDGGTRHLADNYQTQLTPDDVRRALEHAFKASDIPVVVIDEFDKSEEPDLRALTANAIKNLSDYAVNVTVIIVGVADDIGELIDKHESISRCIEQIPMPRMSNDEMKELLQKRLPRLGMKIEADALWKIITLARGLPAYVHLLGLHATQDAIRLRRTVVTVSNVDSAIQRALAKSQESVQREYATATHTNRSDTLFREVLLACALAQTDERGLFTPNAVVGPLSSILKRDIAIANFQNHLKKFIGDERGKILIRRGKERAYKFRFRDPMMQPYVIMKGVEAGLIQANALEVLSAPEQPQLQFPSTQRPAGKNGDG